MHHFSTGGLFQGNTVTVFALRCLRQLLTFEFCVALWSTASAVHDLLRLLLMGTFVTLHDAQSVVKQKELFLVTCFSLNLLPPSTPFSRYLSFLVELKWMGFTSFCSEEVSSLARSWITLFWARLLKFECCICEGAVNRQFLFLDKSQTANNSPLDPSEWRASSIWKFKIPINNCFQLYRMSCSKHDYGEENLSEIVF